MHNLCDGLFIGVGFLACGPTLGWSITAATVYHELAQEISDYLILTNPRQVRVKGEGEGEGRAASREP